VAETTDTRHSDDLGTLRGSGFQRSVKRQSRCGRAIGFPGPENRSPWTAPTAISSRVAEYSPSRPPTTREIHALSRGFGRGARVKYVVGPEGIVVADTNDIYEEYHKSEIAERYGHNRLPNVVRLISNPPELRLGSESFDVVILVLTHHDIYYVSESNPTHPKIDRDRFLQPIYGCLKQGGTLVCTSSKPRGPRGFDDVQLRWQAPAVQYCQAVHGWYQSGPRGRATATAR